MSVTILEEVCKAVKRPYPEGERLTQEALKEIATKSNRLKPEVWNQLRERSQEWLNSCVSAIRAECAIPEPDDYDAAYKPSQAITVPELVLSPGKQVRTPPRASKSDGSTKQGRKGLEEGGPTPVKARRTRKRRTKPIPKDQAGVRSTKRGGTYEVVRTAINHGINDLQLLSTKLELEGIAVSASTVHVGLYGVRHVARAIHDISAGTPELLEPFVQESPAS